MAILVREETIDLHKGLEALTLLHISDIHIWFSGKILDELKAIIYQSKSDLLIFTGDYYDTPKGASIFREFIIELSLTQTMVLIRGNHDFLFGSRIANSYMDIPNCHCVEESIFSFTSVKGYAYMITSWAQRSQLMQLANGKNIALIHNPEKLNEREMKGIDLVLAGHLHGGQFILYKTALNNHFPGNLLYKYCTDRRQIKNTTLVISRGLGDTFPFRLNCPKEVVRITIT
jgi:hypothetical protein